MNLFKKLILTLFSLNLTSSSYMCLNQNKNKINNNINIKEELTLSSEPITDTNVILTFKHLWSKGYYITWPNSNVKIIYINENESFVKDPQINSRLPGYTGTTKIEFNTFSYHPIRYTGMEMNIIKIDSWQIHQYHSITDTDITLTFKRLWGDGFYITWPNKDTKYFYYDRDDLNTKFWKDPEIYSRLPGYTGTTTFTFDYFTYELIEPETNKILITSYQQALTTPLQAWLDAREKGDGYLSSNGSNLQASELFLKGKGEFWGEKYQNLTEINLNNNQITNLNVSNLPDLQSLKIIDNNLTSIDTSKNPKLKNLDINKMRFLNLNF